jgi:ribosomal protein S18 acetylase RimI-like enzyme
MAANMNIRPFDEADWPAVWDFMEPVIRAGEATYVAEDTEGNILGTYYIKPNQPTLGAHVANCGYMVAESARGMGVATKMCQHSQDEAVRMGYRAMQYNLVVKTNEPSVHLWQKMGFAIVGSLPGAFKHAEHGFVDAYVMYKELPEQS